MAIDYGNGNDDGYANAPNALTTKLKLSFIKSQKEAATLTVAAAATATATATHAQICGIRCGCRCRGRFVSGRLDNGSGSDLIPRQAHTHTTHTLAHTFMLINILVLFVAAVSVCE